MHHYGCLNAGRKRDSAATGHPVRTVTACRDLCLRAEGAVALFA